MANQICLKSDCEARGLWAIYLVKRPRTSGWCALLDLPCQNILSLGRQDPKLCSRRRDYRPDGHDYRINAQTISCCNLCWNARSN
eukprot:140335-Amphidinium_carterae.1